MIIKLSDYIDECGNEWGDIDCSYWHCKKCGQPSIHYSDDKCPDCGETIEWVDDRYIVVPHAEKDRNIMITNEIRPL